MTLDSYRRSLDDRQRRGVHGLDGKGTYISQFGEAGEVSSRQSYDPWGAQLSGPALEMGYLGAQQRRADPLSGLIQMGTRSYDPGLGAFLSEDVVYGHAGIGTSFDRYAYAWDNPVNLYDLDGRDVCVPTPFGDACAEEAAEDIGNAAGDVGSSAWKSDVGQWIGDRGNEVGRTFTCIAERVVQQPGPVGCQEEAEKWEPAPEGPEDPPRFPPPGAPGKPAPLPAPVPPVG